jgi:hypothetical protein
MFLRQLLILIGILQLTNNKALNISSCRLYSYASVTTPELADPKKYVLFKNVATTGDCCAKLLELQANSTFFTYVKSKKHCFVGNGTRIRLLRNFMTDSGFTISLTSIQSSIRNNLF